MFSSTIRYCQYQVLMHSNFWWLAVQVFLCFWWLSATLLSVPLVFIVLQSSWRLDGVSGKFSLMFKRSSWHNYGKHSVLSVLPPIRFVFLYPVYILLIPDIQSTFYWYPRTVSFKISEDLFFPRTTCHHRLAELHSKFMSWSEFVILWHHTIVVSVYSLGLQFWTVWD